MKTKKSTRILSLFLSVVMLVTSAPFVAFSADDTATSTDGAYLMAYFTGEDSGEQISFAVSKDGYNYEALNGKQPIISQSMPTAGTQHMRDPYVFRGNDGKFWLLATDLNANASSYSNNAIYTFCSDDLINWTYNSQVVMDDYIPGTTRAWAPQALWDSEKNSYMIYWSQQTDSGITNLYRAYTNDFKTLTDIAQLYAPVDASGNLVNSIDADIIWNNKDNEWCLYYKNEDKQAINMATSKSLAGPYENDAPAIGEALLPKDDKLKAREGCQMFNIHGTDTWILMADAYRSDPKEFFFYTTSDFKNFSNINTSSYQVNHLSPRHGSIMWITNEEYESLVSAYGKATATQSGLRTGEDALDFLIARYFADYNNPATDSSGKNHPLTTTSNLDMTVTDDIIAAHFDSSKSAYGAVNTQQMFSSANANIKDGITITFRAKANDDGSGNIHYFDFTDSPFGTITGGTLGFGSNKKSYNDLFLQTSGRFELMQTGKEYQKNNSNSDFSMPTQAWHTYSFSISYGTVAVAVDGVLQKLYVDTDGTIDNNSWFNSVFMGSNSKLGLGISAWVDDPYFDGYISDFCIFSRALTSAEAFGAMESLLDAPEKSIDAVSQLYFDSCGSDYKFTDTAPDTAYGSNIVTDDTYENVLSTNGTVINSYVPSFTNSNSSADGYTINFMYNPQSTIENTSILDIGNSKLTLTEDGTLAFKSGTGSSYTANNVFGDAIKANTWHNITVQVVPNIAFERIFVYVDGVLTSTTDTYLNMDGSNYPNPNICSAVFESGTQNVAYGSATGLLNNVAIYSGCVSASSLKRNEDAIYASKIIYQEIAAFEDAVKTWNAADGRILTGVGDAYKAYDACKRYLDSIEYGETVPNADDYAALAADLRDATATMLNSTYTIPQATGTYLVNDGSNSGDSEIIGKSRVDANTILPGSATNILYSSGIAEKAADNDRQKTDITLFTNTDRTLAANVEYGDTFFLFDGTNNTFNMPVMFSGKINKTDTVGGPNTRIITTVYPTKSVDDPSDSGIFKLLGHLDGNSSCSASSESHWHGFVSKGVTNFNSIVNTSSSDETKGGKDWFGGDAADTGDRYSTDYCYYNVGQPAGKTFYHSNVLGFDVSALNGDGNNYSGYAPFSDSYTDENGNKIDTSAWIGKSKIAGQYNISWAIVGNSEKKEAAKTWNYATEYEKAIFQHDLRYVYLIDDSELLKILNSKNLENYIHNIADYTSDSALHFCEAVDALTAVKFDVNFSQGLSEGAKLQQRIDSAVNDFNQSILNGAADQLTPKGDYDSLKEQVKEYAPVYEEPDYSKYTTDSIDEFRATYENYVNHFTNMNPTLDNSQNYLSTPELTSTDFGGRLDIKYAQLMEKVDYTELQNNNAQFGHENLFSTEDSNVQNYSYNSWVPYEEVTTLSNALIENDSVTLSKINDVNGQPLTDENGNVLSFGADNTPRYATTDVTYTLSDGSTATYKIPTNHLTSDYLVGTPSYNDSDKDKASRHGEIVDSTAAEIQPRQEKLDPVADYSAYNATTDLLKYQDVGAFSDEYLTSEDSVYSQVALQGTKDFRVTYKNGVASGVTCTTPSYNGNQTAYVNVNSRVLMNTGLSQQSALDATTVKILTTLQNANETETGSNVRRTYTVTFKIMIGDTPETASLYLERAKDWYYGEEYTAEVPSNLTCYKWIVKTGDANPKEVPASQSYTAMIQNNVEIIAYCSTQELADDVVKLRVLNQYGKTIQEYNIPSDAVVSLDTNKYTIDGNDYAVNDTPFYRFSKWQVNGVYVENGQTISLTDLKDAAGVVTIRPRFVVADTTYEVTIDGNKVTNNGNPLYYDTDVTVNSVDGAYGIVVEIGDLYYVVAYTAEGAPNAEYSFFTYAGITMYSILKDDDGNYTINNADNTQITDAETLRKLDAKLPFVYAVPQMNDRFTTYSTYSKGVAAVVTEVGTLYTTDPSVAADPDTFVFGNANVKCVKATNPLDTNQYFLRIKTNGISVYTRPYVKYKYNPSVNEGNVDQGTLIQSIEYGNISASN